MINWSLEWPQIVNVAALYAVDPMFIAAIRKAENGAPGREFGVLSEDAPTYTAQLHATCATVRDRVFAYPQSLFAIMQGNRVKRLTYGSGFIAFFANKWAPPDADNDPNGLNANWVRNATDAYLKAIRAGSLS